MKLRPLLDYAIAFGAGVFCIWVGMTIGSVRSGAGDVLAFSGSLLGSLVGVLGAIGVIELQSRATSKNSKIYLVELIKEIRTSADLLSIEMDKLAKTPDFDVGKIIIYYEILMWSFDEVKEHPFCKRGDAGFIRSFVRHFKLSTRAWEKGAGRDKTIDLDILRDHPIEFDDHVKMLNREAASTLSELKRMKH